MILITGAAGKTGRAICRALVRKEQSVRALVRREEQARDLLSFGVKEAITGDMRDYQVLKQAFIGVRKVYHICPNMSPDELSIGESVIAAAQAAGVEGFVYHSVFRPQIQAMPHHWQKMLVEEKLFRSGLKVTVLQPAAYLQNLLGYWNAMMTEGIYAVPYSIDSRLSMVDLEDVAEVAALTLTEDDHAQAEYELCGSEALSAEDIAERVSAKTGRVIQAVALDRGEWQQRMATSQMSDYARETLLKMFEYYDEYGLVGNPKVLRCLLGRPPSSFADFLERLVS